MLKAALVLPPPPDRAGPIRVPFAAAITLLGAAALMVIFGLFPAVVLGWF